MRFSLVVALLSRARQTLYALSAAKSKQEIQISKYYSGNHHIPMAPVSNRFGWPGTMKNHHTKTRSRPLTMRPASPSCVTSLKLERAFILEAPPGRCSCRPLVFLPLERFPSKYDSGHFQMIPNHPAAHAKHEVPMG